MAQGDNLTARIAASAGTEYFVDGALGARANGGTSEAVRSSGANGVTNGTNTLTSVTGTWSAADIGHGIKIDVGGTAHWRKITAVASATSLTFSGATIAAASGRSWVVGGAWKEPQDFFDLAGTASVSPVPGDICTVKEWKTTLTSAIDGSTTTVPVASTAGFPASGTAFPIQLESEGVHSVGDDGTTNGTNTLTDSEAAWSSADIGRVIWIEVGTIWEKRSITAVASATSLTFSGATIVGAASRNWRIYTIEVMSCTSYVGLNLTVARGFAGSTAVAHANGARVDVPYQGKRATSLADTGGRHVVNSSGTVGGVYTVRNYSGHFVYLHPNANLAQGSQNECIVIRNSAAYWRFQGMRGGGEFFFERGRAGAGNPANVYVVNLSANIEFYGIKCRFAQAGSGIFIEDTVSNFQAYNTHSYLNDIDITTQHHGWYNQGAGSQFVNCIGSDHTNGFGIQHRVTGTTPIAVNCLWIRNGGTGGGLVIESDTTAARVYNSIVLDNNRGIRQLTGGVAPGADVDNEAIKNIVNGNFTANLTNDTPGSNQAFKWDIANTDKTASGPGDNSTADPLLVNRDGVALSDWKLTASSPARGFGVVAWSPTFDFFDNPRNGVCDAGPFAYIPASGSGARVAKMRLAGAASLRL